MNGVCPPGSEGQVPWSVMRCRLYYLLYFCCHIRWICDLEGKFFAKVNFYFYIKNFFSRVRGTGTLIRAVRGWGWNSLALLDPVHLPPCSEGRVQTQRCGVLLVSVLKLQVRAQTCHKSNKNHKKSRHSGFTFWWICLFYLILWQIGGIIGKGPSNPRCINVPVPLTLAIALKWKIRYLWESVYHAQYSEGRTSDKVRLSRSFRI